jgi:NADPH-dependent F420 reductase
MRIAVVGGTGKEGRGLALRWARAGHQVLIGSRDAERARQKAVELSGSAGPASAVLLEGGDNAWAVRQAEVVVLSVPYAAHESTLRELAEELAGRVLIDITVPLRPPKVTEVHVPPGTAAALEAQALLGDATAVAAALHHVSSVHLADPEHAIDCDVLVATDDDRAREVTLRLVGDLGLRGLDAGPLRNAAALESLTPVLLYLNKRYKGTGAGIKFTGLP